MYVAELLTGLGAATLRWLARLGRISMLSMQIFCAIPSALLRPRLIIKQIHVLGVLSLPIIAVAGLFVGMVLSFQGYSNLAKFGAAASVGTVVALSLLRELGPVLSALLYTGRAGSALTAEIGLMQATEQWSSLEIMAVDPVRYILAPRFIAGILVLPLLTGIFTAIGIIGGYWIAVAQLGVDGGAFWSQMQSSVDLYQDIVQGVLIKSICFALICNVIALYEGVDARPTSEGVARATTRTVVSASLAVLGLDFLLTAMMYS